MFYTVVCVLPRRPQEYPTLRKVDSQRTLAGDIYPCPQMVQGKHKKPGLGYTELNAMLVNFSDTYRLFYSQLEMQFYQ